MNPTTSFVQHGKGIHVRHAGLAYRPFVWVAPSPRRFFCLLDGEGCERWLHASCGRTRAGKEVVRFRSSALPSVKICSLLGMGPFCGEDDHDSIFSQRVFAKR